MDVSTVEPDESDRKVTKAYPGTDATVGQLMMLGNEYYTAAHTLLRQWSPQEVYSSAPMRLCAIHAIELYLNAFLRFHDLSAEEIRGWQHKLAERAEVARGKGLRLRLKTVDHLNWMSDQREYLLVRYGPESMSNLSQPNRIFATLREVYQKVASTIYDQPYEPTDPRFKKYWQLANSPNN